MKSFWVSTWIDFQTHKKRFKMFLWQRRISDNWSVPIPTYLPTYLPTQMLEQVKWALKEQKVKETEKEIDNEREKECESRKTNKNGRY